MELGISAFKSQFWELLAMRLTLAALVSAHPCPLALITTGSAAQLLTASTCFNVTGKTCFSPSPREVHKWPGMRAPWKQPQSRLTGVGEKYPAPTSLIREFWDMNTRLPECVPGRIKLCSSTAATGLIMNISLATLPSSSHFPHSLLSSWELFSKSLAPGSFSGSVSGEPALRQWRDK